MKKLVFLCVSFLFLLQSCSKTEVVETLDTTEITTNGLSLRDAVLEQDYLKFNSVEHYRNALEEITQMDKKSVIAWAKAKNFSSMQIRYDEMLQDYELLAETAESFADVVTFRRHYNEIAMFENTGEVDMNVPVGIDATLLNTKGMVKIANDILIYSSDKLVTIVGGDANKITEAMQATVSNLDMSIIVKPIITVATNDRTPCGGAAVSNIKVHEQTNYLYENGNQKYKLITELWVHNTDVGTNSTAAIGFKLRTFKRGLFGAWYSQATDISISATVGAEYVQEWYTPAPNAPQQTITGSGSAGGSVNTTADGYSSLSYFPLNAYALSPYYLSTIINGGLSLPGQGSHWEGCFDSTQIIADFPGSNTVIIQNL